jgi:hypothetical protein
MSWVSAVAGEELVPRARLLMLPMTGEWLATGVRNE